MFYRKAPLDSGKFAHIKIEAIRQRHPSCRREEREGPGTGTRDFLLPRGSRLSGQDNNPQPSVHNLPHVRKSRRPILSRGKPCLFLSSRHGPRNLPSDAGPYRIYISRNSPLSRTRSISAKPFYTLPGFWSEYMVIRDTERSDNRTGKTKRASCNLPRVGA
jgi:hypothetical protein